MPVMTRLKDKGMLETDRCPLCGNREDHDHLIKKCAQLQQPLRILRMAFKPVTVHGTRIEISRMVMEEPALSLTTEQGLTLWMAIVTLWRQRCGVHWKRERPQEKIFIGAWIEELRRPGRRKDAPICRDNKQSSGGAERMASQQTVHRTISG